MCEQGIISPLLASLSESFPGDLKIGFALVFALVLGSRLNPAGSGCFRAFLADLRKLPVDLRPRPSFPVPGLIMSPLL